LERKHFFQRILRFLDPLAIGLFLGVALPWYLAVSWKTGGEWVYEFIFHHNLNRFAEPMEGHGGGFYLPVVMVVLGLFPGSLFLPALVRRLRFWRKMPFQIRFAVLFSAFTVVFFMFSGTKLPNYPAPLYPMLALALGWQMSKGGIRDLRWPGLVGSVFLLIFPGIFHSVSPQIPELKSLQAYWVVFVISALIALTGIVYWVMRYYLMNWILMTLGFAVFGFFMLTTLFPKLDAQNPVSQSRAIWERSASVYFFRQFNPAFPFAMNKVIPALPVGESIPSGALILTTSRNLPTLDSLDLGYREVVRKRDLFERTETVILRVD
jgi:4-amino-4-deoxy-L-arabinose transferase-like glycosyltransferase